MLENTIIAALRTGLLAVPTVSAVHLVAAATKGEAGLVAYVVGGQRKALDAAIVDSGYPGSVALVRVYALPLRADGCVDDKALAALPAWSQASLPPTAVYRPIVPLRPRIHLADILPDYPLLTSTVHETLLSRTPLNGAADKLAISRLRPLPSQPQMPANLADALERAAQHPELGIVHVAADMSEMRVSYAELFDQARRILGGLRAHGVRSGDVVLVDATYSRSLLPLFWACILGAVVPAPFKLAAAAAGGASLKRLRDSWEVLGRPVIAADPASLQALAPLGVDALSEMTLLDASELGRAESAIPSPASDLHALSMVFMTSGSTGLPKGVMLSQANMLAMIGGIAERAPALTPGATTMNWMPLDHVAGLGFLSILPLVLGMNQIQVDTATVLEAPVRWLELVHRHRVCMVWTPNFAFELLLKATAAPTTARDWDLSHLRVIMNGGEVVSDRVLTAFAARFAENKLPADAIWPAFGMTETVSVLSMSPWVPGNGEVVSLGVPVCGAAHRIVDEHGEIVAEGVIGAVELSGDQLFMGYYGRDDLTAEAMRGNWFHSGDMGIIRDEALFVVGRIKEMIIVNGANFYSGEIEEVVTQTDGVERLSIAAIGVRAPAAHTDQLALFFHAPAARDDAALRRVMQDMRMHLGKQLSLMPTYFIHVPADRLPRTNSGKVQRIALKGMIESGVFDAEVKHAACLLEASGTIPRWFSAPFWKPCEIVATAGEPSQTLSIAVLGNALASDAAIRAGLVNATTDIAWRQMALQEQDDTLPYLSRLFHAMAQQTALDAVVVLPGWAGLAKLQLLCQALAGIARADRPMRLIVCGAATDTNEHAAAAAFLRASAAEIDGVHCLHIQFSGKDLLDDAGMILGDLRQHTGETELAYIHGRRHLRRWRSVEIEKADRPALRSHGLYLISGGLGGVGLLLARHLLDRHDANLLIVGRTARSQLHDARATALQALERSGRVLYACADVADVDALRVAVEQARARWHCGLAGVLHLAGEPPQTTFGHETVAALAQMMHSKVAGSLALHTLLEDHPDAWLILVGSVAGMVTGRQDVAYAAANAYQTAMAERLAASGNTRCRYLGFSSWRDTGISKNGATVLAVEAAGYFSLEPEQAVASFDIALSASCPVLAIGLDLQHARQAALQDAAIAVDEPVVFQTAPASQDHVMLLDHFGRSLPVGILTVDAIVRDASGTVDREQLVQMADGFLHRGHPSSEFERCMVQLWTQILGLSRCGVDDDFFALGGNSLRAAQITAITRERFRLNATLPDLLQKPTVTGFCTHVQQGEIKPGITEAIARRWLQIEQMTLEQKRGMRCCEDGMTIPDVSAMDEELDTVLLADLLAEDGFELPLEKHAILPRAASARVLATPAQQRLWTVERIAGVTGEFNIGLDIRFNAAINVGALEQALLALLQRHEGLRVAFIAHEDGSLQQTFKQVDKVFLPQQVVAVASWPAYRREAVAQPFDLASDLLLRAQILQDDAGGDGGESALLLTFHHSIMDMWAGHLLLRELVVLYSRELGASVTLPKPVPFGDYAVWLREPPQALAREQLHGYWKARLAQLPVALELPFSGPRGQAGSALCERIPLALSASLTAAVKGFADAVGTTPFVVMLTAFHSMLARYSDRDDIAIGVPVVNRSQRQEQDIVGFLTETMVSRNVSQRSQSFRALTEQVRDHMLEDLRHQVLPFNEIVNLVNPERRKGLAPLFQAMLVFQTMPPLEAYAGEVHAKAASVPLPAARADLVLELEAGAEYIDGALEYRCNFIEPQIAAAMASSLEVLLEAALTDPQLPLSQLPLQRRAVAHDMLARFNPPLPAASPYTLSTWFAEQAAKMPDAVALIDAEGGGETTYAELDRRSAALAAHLVQLGVVAETPVAICLPRSVELAVAILATLRAGGAFVPMDPDFPAERLHYMLSSSGAKVLMTTGAPAWLRAAVSVEHQISLVDPGQAFPQASAPLDVNRPDSLLYILYTSGSTGRPKAVMGLHRGAVNRIAWMTARYPFEPNDRYCQKTTPTFVDFIWELFGPLLGGVPSVMLSAAQVRDPRALASALQRHRVTRLTLVPSLLKSLLDHVADSGQVLSGLHHCTSSGEALPVDLARRFRSLLPHCLLLNLYGSSEASADATYHEVDVADGPQVQIGRPIPGNLLAILDPAGNVLPVGVAGEIAIGGIGLARGYLGSVVGGESRFVTLPAEIAGGRAFCSGDLGRWRPEGGIDYMGRLDRQVKIRGVRIDPQEVRAALRSYPGVTDAAVLARDIGDELILVAYVAAKDVVEIALRRRLQDILPTALQPSRYVFMPALPLNANGKIDFLALPAPGEAPTVQVLSQSQPQDALVTLEENLLADIWSQVIGQRPQHPHANFFQSGGHSLSAVRLVAAIEKNLGVYLPVTAVFDAPTLYAMALAVRHAQPRAVLPDIVAGGPHRRARASFNQERLWLIEQAGPQRGAYNQAVTYRLRGNLDVDRLELAFRRVIQRHEALRTRLVRANGMLWQEVEARPQFVLGRRDGDQASEANSTVLLQEFIDVFFSLADDLPLRATLIRLGSSEHLLAIVVHHTAIDGSAGRVMIDELGQAYRDTLETASAALQHIDFSEWQRKNEEQGAFESQRHYWREQLAGAPAVLGLALSRMPEHRDFRLGRVPLSLGRERSNRLQQAANDAGLSVFALLLGVWGVTLARFGGEHEVVVGIPVAGRSRVDLDGIVGFLANTLPMRIDCIAANLAQLGHRVQQRIAEGMQNQDISFSQIVEAAAVERLPQRSPLFQAMFVLADLYQWQLQLDDIDAAAEPLPVSLARTDLGMALNQGAQGIAGDLEYAADIIASELAERIAAGFVHLLDALLTQPELPPLSHTLLDAPSLALLKQFGQARVVLPPARQPMLLYDLLRASALRNGDAPALATPEGEISYRQLDRLSGDFAQRLRTAGLNPGDRVALIGERSIGLIAALLGISKAGCVFVPIDPSYPSVRIGQMLHDADVALVVGDRPADWNETQWMRLPVLEDLSCLPEQDESKQSHGAFDQDFAATACIIFTSGSTGRPKGVALSHHALCRLAQSAITEFSVTQESRILQLAAFGFDVAVSDIVFALAAGACLCLAPRERLLPGSPLLQTLDAMNITHLQIPAALLAAMPVAPLPKLRTLIVGGELCPAAVASQWQQGRDLFIAYGPTETTVTVTAGRYAGADVPLQIGRPLGDARIYVLDEQGAQVPIGVVGELCIGGPGVSIGYLNNPALTQERFQPDPFAGDAQARMYRSGDRARWREDGSLDFLGRSDREFKLRGFRIAPAEIEAALSQQPGVTQALAMIRPDSAGERRLVAYVVGTGTDAATLRSELRRSLPSFMVPDFISILEGMPLTSNGKIDVNALPLPVFEREGAGNPESGAVRDCLARVTALWRQVLNLKDIAPDANFFDVGGHSLLLVRLYDLLTAEFGTVASISDLFRFPTIRSLAEHLSGHEDIQETEQTAPTVHSPLPAQADIAVIGMACRFPGAPDVDAFWQLLVEGREGLSHHDPASLAAAGRTAEVLQQANFVGAGGVIGQADCFDADFFGLGPRDAVTLDPQHRVALECAWHALEHGGYAAVKSRDNVDVGVFVGVGANTYLQGQLFAAGPMPESADSYHAMSGNDKDFGATRIAYHLDLKGPALAVQTACSSSLTALDMACRSLRSGGAGMALAGGVAIRFPQGGGYLHEPGMILSPDGHCKPFSADARGTVPSGGVGMVLLKPLAQAQADGDNVLAVIRGSAVNNDGGRKVGYAAPGVDGQAAVIASALRQAGLEPADIDYIEAHGTGTELGDPVEVAAITRVFGGRQRPLALGSVKSNIGHADAAAGVAGLIKTILALQHGVLPPSLHFSAPNPHVDFTAASISVVGAVQAWPAQQGDHPRRAGVSAFGIGGTNVHVVLEQAPARLKNTATKISPQILPLSARTPASLRSSMLALADVLQSQPQLALRDVAFTLQQGRAAFGYRHAIVASGNEEAMIALRLAAEQSGTEPVAAVKEAARLAFLLPGQGSQYPRMAQALYESDAGYRAWFDRCAVALLPHVEHDIRTVLYGVAADDPAAVTALRQTALAQPVLFSVMYALARSLEARGVEAVAMLGHSLGEYVAACLAGVFELDDALALVAMRGRLMQALPGGAMLAVQADEIQTRALMRDCGDAISLAAVNGPGQCVLSGATDAIDALQARLKEIDVAAVRLDTSHAFHSAAMDPVLPAFIAQFDRITLKPPQRRFISNITGTWISDADAVDPAYWARHLRQAVRFGDGLDTLQRDGIELLLEVGPGSALQKLARTGGWSAAQLIVSGLHRQASRQASALEDIVAQLWTRGAVIDWRKGQASPPESDDAGTPSRVALPGYVFERTRHWPAPQSAVAANVNSQERRADIADWFYLPGWQRAPQLSAIGPSTASTASTASDVWLLLGAETVAGRALTTGLRATGQQVVEVRAAASFEALSSQDYAIDPASGDDYRRLFDSVTPTRVVHLWASVAQPFETALERGFASLMLLAQAIGADSRARTLQLDIVTCGAADVSGDESLAASLGTLLGLAKILPVEYRSLTCRLIDIEAEGSAAMLLSELLHAKAEPQVALRRRHRWVPQLQPVRLAAPEAGSDRLHKQGCYLITGAFGGMGASIARDLAARCRARLVLLGRHVDRALVAELEREGIEVFASACDVADAAALTPAIASAHARFGVIHGVFHCAGVADLGGIIQNRSVASMHQVMAAKVQGTVLLDRLLEGDALDFMVLFSTLGSLLPQAKFGQAAYAAANEFLNLFAHERNARGGGFTTVLNWDDWSEAGMTVAAYRRHGQAAPDSKEAMRSQEGIEVLRRVLASPHARVAVSIRDLPGLIARADVLLDKLSAPMPLSPASTDLSASEDASGMSNMTDTEAKLAASWRSILGVAAITREANFFELGGHSLIGMRLLAFVRESFGVDLNITAVFEYATLAALAGHIDQCRSGDDGIEEFTI